MILSGLSGNELYCLAQKGWAPGHLVVGNSVMSLGLVGNLGSALRSLTGGEVTNITEMISEGRHAAIKRLEQEAQQQGAHGVTGVNSDLKQISSLTEFIAIGSAVKGAEHHGPFFTTSCSGQDLYCQLDAGFQPKQFVIGNVAYALGLGRGIVGALRSVGGGEVKEYSQMYNHTRHLALERLEAEARQCGANAVVDIQTYILPLGPGVSEMLMVGTASHNPVLGNPAQPVTSELTGEELWNLSRMGYQPLRLLMGSSVYALGVAGGIGAFLKSFSKGEVNNMTRLIYEARANCMEHIEKEAKEIAADAVIDTKLFIHDIGGSFLEVFAIGTAIKKNPAVTTQTDHLIPQAIIRDRPTFFDRSHQSPAIAAH
jgi:uncharacterized protein YbjQ (UPF0145 family)